ncbi:putative NADPH-cytochrome P450 reductase [Leptodontidium sp. 2 PMI_412]|nr:putative NADPH-cytochrome P450 reductase [Leptodontidium sp. 2 PMI_412]
MASDNSLNFLSQTTPQISDFFKPTSTADLLTIAAVVLCSTSYLLKGIAWNKPDPHAYQLFQRPQLADGASILSKKETRNITLKLEEHKKDLVIFWGSQSGTAEGLANRLGRDIHLRFGLDVLVADLSDYNADTIALIPETKLALFIISTYGEGDPSDNTAGFWDWIHRTAEKSPSLRYAAFGLGNSNYKHYNRVVDVTVAALDSFGARSIMPVGKADDVEGGTEEDFMAWKGHLFEVFGTLGYQEVSWKYMPTFEVVEDDSLAPIDLHDGEPTHLDSSRSCSAVRALKVLNSKELFKSGDRNCLHMDLALTEHPDLHYKTGDHLAVWPINPEEEVQLLLKVLGRSDMPITVKSLDSTVRIKIPTPTSTATLFRHYLEVCAPVSRETVLGLAYFAPTEEAKVYLNEIGRDKDIYNTFLSQQYLTIGRMMALACPNTPWAVPLSYIIETLPHLQPRYYSISSSSVISPRQPSITVLVANTALASGQTVPGLTSNYLLALSNPQSQPHKFSGPSAKLEDGRLFAHIRKSKFKLPVQSSCPLVMIAAGTGLAPFMAFLAERKKLMDIGWPVGQMMVFFGCRDVSDFIYREEIEELQQTFGEKLVIVTAFSRAGDKRYVQDGITEKSDDILGLVENGANVYICGRANMSKDVGRSLGDKMKERNGWSDEELGEWSRKLKGMRKWQEDVWG